MADEVDAAYARLKDAPLIGDQVRELIGCHWGRGLAVEADREPCGARATRMVILHDGDDRQTSPIKLCERHYALVIELTAPHDDG